MRNLGRRLTYGLRFHILPDEHASRRGREVLEFCKRHGVDEVHLFVYPEEWNRGHVTEGELKEFSRVLIGVVARFKKAGLRVGCNPWITVLHCERGRTLRPGQDFQTIVSPTGQKSTTCASMACPQWLQAITRQYQDLARMGFDVIWLEDDWRYHNHDPLDWGGGFEEGFLERFSECVGQKVSREELVAALLKPGEPHPWRKAWLDVWRAQSESNAAAIRDAVQSVSPHATLGLMSSSPEVHCSEGRDWSGLFDAMAIEGRVIHRPHFASYGEAPGTCLSWSAAMLDVQRSLRPAHILSAPELENFPFGRFSKSDTLTFAQMAMAQVYGSDGILLDLHPMTGNGVEGEPGMGQLLDRSRPGLELLSRLCASEMSAQGMGVPFNPQASERIHTTCGQSMTELYPKVIGSAALLGRLGVAFQLRRSAHVNALWGNNAWAFDDSEIQEMLKAGLWLDAEAAWILSERGFGELLGVDGLRWMDRQDSSYSMEEVASKASGVLPGTRLTLNTLPRLLSMEPTRKAQEWSSVVDWNGQRIGAAMVVSTNKLAGRVAISAADLAGDAPPALSFQRRNMAQAVIRFLAGKQAPLMVSGDPHLLPVDLTDGRERRAIIVNMWPDEATEAILHSPSPLKPTSWWLVAPLRKPKNVKSSEPGARALRCPCPLSPLSFAVVVL